MDLAARLRLATRNLEGAFGASLAARLRLATRNLEGAFGASLAARLRLATRETRFSASFVAAGFVLG